MLFSKASIFFAIFSFQDSCMLLISILHVPAYTKLEKIERSVVKLKLPENAHSKTHVGLQTHLCLPTDLLLLEQALPKQILQLALLLLIAHISLALALCDRLALRSLRLSLLLSYRFFDFECLGLGLPLLR